MRKKLIDLVIATGELEGLCVIDVKHNEDASKVYVAASEEYVGHESLYVFDINGDKATLESKSTSEFRVDPFWVRS